MTFKDPLRLHFWRVEESPCLPVLLGEINSGAKKAISPTYQPAMVTKCPPATEINPYFPP